MSDNGYGNQGQPPVPPSNYPYANQQTDSYTQANAYPTQSYSTQNYTTQMPDYTQPLHSASTAAAATQAPKQKKAGFGKTFLAGFLGAALACAIAGGGFAAYSSTHGNGSGSGSTVLGSTSNTPITASEGDDRAEAVANKVLPSVVGIDVYTSSSSASGWGSLFDSGSDSLTYSGLGSGVIISSDGYILTNYHVVEGADALEVTANGDDYEAEVVGVDESSDLAVIKIDAEGLTAIEIGDSESLVPGQWVMTVGSPFGLEQSVATGIVSATSRTVTVQNATTDDYSYYFGGASSGDVSIYSNMIQTDAAINPGNSGGALVDANGQLIGINAVIESYSGSYSGVGFAIPVSYAMNIAQQIIDGETPTHAQLGVSATTITSDIASRYDLDVDEGAYVSAVYEGSAASDAGLETGDIIIAVDDTKITSSTDLVAACRSHQVGDEITITYVRDGKTDTVNVTLGSDEENLSAAPTTEQGEMQVDPHDQGMGEDGGSGDMFGFNFNFGGSYDEQDSSGNTSGAAA